MPTQFQGEKRNAMRRSCLSGLIALALCGNHAWTADAKDDFFEFMAQEAMVVSATKYPRKASDAPANAYVITTEDIETYGYRTLADALQSVPGMYAMDDRNYSYLWVRGFGRPGDYNSRVLLLINGHRMNDNLYGGSYVQHELSLPIEAVDHIEVIKGPGSALHGDNAFFAVINVITKKPSTWEGARLAASGGSYGTHNEYLGLSRRFSNGLEVSAHGSYRHMDGQDLSYPAYSAVNDGIAENADEEENYTGYAEISKGGLTFRGNSASRSKRIPTGAFGTRFNDSGTKAYDSRDFAEMKIERSLSSAVKATVRAYYDWYSYGGDYVLDGSSIPPERKVNKDVSKSSWYGEETNLQIAPEGSKNTLLLGHEYEKNVRGLQRNFDLDPYSLLVDDNRALYRWAMFAQQEWWLSRSLGLTAGVRYDHYESFGKTVNPRTVLVYQPWQGGTAKAIYGQAFRAPTPFEMFYGQSGFYAANPDLDPERIRSYETRFEQELPEHRGAVGLGVFQNRVRDLISQIVDDAGALVYVNRDKIVSRGLEVNSRWNITHSLSWRTDYTWQRTEEESGERLSNSPEHSGSVGLRQRLSPWDTTLGLEMFVLGARKTFQGTVLATTAVLNFNIVTHPFSPDLGIHVGVYNFTNASYAASGAGEHAQDAIPQNGRNFQAGVDYRFGPR